MMTPEPTPQGGMGSHAHTIWGGGPWATGCRTYMAMPQKQCVCSIKPATTNPLLAFHVCEGLAVSPWFAFQIVLTFCLFQNLRLLNKPTPSAFVFLFKRSRVFRRAWCAEPSTYGLIDNDQLTEMFLPGRRNYSTSKSLKVDIGTVGEALTRSY